MPFTGLLISRLECLDAVSEDIRKVLGMPAMETPVTEWTYSTFYQPEMGKPLHRKYVFFQRLIDPSRLRELKIWSNDQEERYGRKEGEKLMRRVNIDPGYLDRSKIVLASTKNPGHRIYLGDGIHAEISLLYRRGTYRPLDYTYPDIRSRESLAMFNDARSLYLELLKDAGP